MSALRKQLPALTLIGAALFSGIVHGVWSDRWTTAQAPQEAAAKLAGVPKTIGDWDGQEDPVDARELRISEASGILKRRYLNRRTGSVVSLMLVCGRPGPVCVHTPDACYR